MVVVIFDRILILDILEVDFDRDLVAAPLLLRLLLLLLLLLLLRLLLLLLL